MKKFWVLMASVIVLNFPGYSYPEEDQKDKKTSVTMEEVVVTATRTEVALEKIGGSSVTVITSKEIEAKKQNSVHEILRGVPGLDIVTNGGPGSLSNVFIRGADSRNTLILVDGVMLNDPSSANRSANLANISVDNIERIEVVRGPMSVLYGSNATAGVINIITKKGESKPTLFVGSEGGSYDTWKAYGGFSGGFEKINLSFEASRIKTDGFSRANDDNDRIPHDGNTSEGDGWRNFTLSTRLGINITPDFDIDAILRYFDGKTEIDDFGPGYAGDRFDGFPPVPNPTGRKDQQIENDEVFAKINIHNYFLDRFFESNLYLQASTQDRKILTADGITSSDFEGLTRDLWWQGGLNFHNANILTFGLSSFKENMDSQSSFIRDESAYTGSIWAQDQWFLLDDSLVIVAGIRLDDHDQFGSKATYRFAPSYTIDQTQTTIKGSYGTGFRAPSLFELYSAFGNEDLDPEESEGWDFGFEQGFMDNRLKLGLTYFSLNFDNRIDFDLATFRYTQATGETETGGIEGFVQWTPLSDLDLLLNYTYNSTEDPDGERLVRRPRNKVHFNARYRFLEKGVFNFDFYWVDDRKTISSAGDQFGNAVDKLDAYTLVNLSAYYDINKDLQVYGRVDNLFDEEYEEVWSFATPGLAAYIGLKFSYQ